MENKFSIVENISAMKTRKTDTLSSPSPTIAGTTDSEITVTNHHPPLQSTIYEQIMASRRARALQQVSTRQTTAPAPQNSTAIYEQVMASRRAQALQISSRQTPTPASQNNSTTTMYEQITASRRTPTLQTSSRQTPTQQNSTIIYEQTTASKRTDALEISTRQTQTHTPQNSTTLYEQIMASRRAAALQIPTRRQTSAHITNIRKTNWSYNEEKDEEEPFGFKKEFFYNNDDFYTKYR